MDVGVLGPLQIHTSDRTVEIGGARQRALLAALVAHRGRTVGTDLLIDTLWPHDPPPSARHTLHTHVSRLRHDVDLPIRASDGGYALDLPTSCVDAARFDALLLEAVRSGPAEAVTLTERALRLWRGPAYGSAASLPAVRAEARRLEERRLGAREDLVRRLVAAGRAADAVMIAEALVADEPTRESAWTGLVRALVAAGRSADGTTAYQRAVAALDELGLVPSAALRTVQAEALGARTPYPSAPTDRAAPTDRPAPRPGRTASAIPVPPTSFLGREEDVAAVQRLLGAARLVTLVGPGGVGKTRLALEVARRCVPDHASGGRIVELTTVTDAPTVPTATLAALGLGVDAGPPREALRRAGDLDVFVVVDNCEHVIDAVAEMVERLLAGSRATVLATSRERLGVPGEQVYVVPPLALADDRPTARLLFLDRAVAAGGAAAGDLDPALVDRVVRGLDGLPLAIEMAAARTATVGLTELAGMLAPEPAPGPPDDAGSGTGTTPEVALAELRHPHRRGTERHRSLGAVIAWSEALLEPAEQHTVARWPVFVGPVEAADAAGVLGAARNTVEGLVHKSLLLPAPDPATGRTRYRMLHTVRSAVLAEHGRAGLPSPDHAAHFARVAADADAALRGPGEAAAVSRLGSTIAELRSAHTWAREHDHTLATGLSASLHLFAVSTLDEEVLGWAARMVPRLDERDPQAATAHASVAARLVQAGQLPAAVARARLALDLADQDGPRLRALETLTDAAIYDGRLEECCTYAQQLADRALDVGDAHYLAMATSSLSLALAYGGEHAAARSELDRLGAVLTARFAPLSPTVLGWLAFADGEIDLDTDPARAATSLSRAVALADSVGNRYLGGVARVSATSVGARYGDPVAALGSFEEIIGWWLERGDRTHLLTTLRTMVDLFDRLDAPDAAAELWGAVAGGGLSTSYGTERARLDTARDRLEDLLGSVVLADRLAVGATRDVEAAARAALDAAGRLRSR